MAGPGFCKPVPNIVYRMSHYQTSLRTSLEIVLRCLSERSIGIRPRVKQTARQPQFED
jgi:hypothetical protein